MNLIYMYHSFLLVRHGTTIPKNSYAATDSQTQTEGTRSKLQFGAAERAESVVGLHNSFAESATQYIGDFRQRRGGLGWRWEGVRLREEELAIVTIQEWVLAWPPPNGNKEELQHLVVFH